MNENPGRLGTLWRHSGIFLFLIGVTHTCFGLWLGYSVVLQMLGDGLINAGAVGDVIPKMVSIYFMDGMVQMDHVPGLQRFGLVWFIWSGLTWMGFGLFIHQWVRETNQPPGKPLAIFFLLFGSLGALIYPVSGFWLFLPLALILFVGKP
jgi:hypothetical protein